MIIKLSWFIFYFLSAEKPFRLQKAYLEMILIDYLSFLACWESSYPQSNGDNLMLYCDLVLVCLTTFFCSITFFFLSISCWGRQLIVFLCNFFFLEAILTAELFPKIFKFFISMLILIFCDLGKGANEFSILLINCILDKEFSLGSLFNLSDFLGVFNIFYLVYWKYF